MSKSDSLSVAVRDEQARWEHDSVGAGSRVFSLVDSSGHEYLAEIVPSGAFTFSAEKGFSGQASILRLRGKVYSSARLSDSLEQRTVLQESAAVDRQSETKREGSSVSREPTGGSSWIWMFLVLAMLAALLWALWNGAFRGL